MAIKKKKKIKGQITKTKLGSASRFGARYGSKHKKKINIFEQTKRRQKCPKCGRASLRRESFAVWQCTKCRAKIAGGAYIPKTPLGELIDKIFSKKLSKEEIEKLTKEFEKSQEKTEEVKEEKSQTKKKEKPKKEAEEENPETDEEQEKATEEE